MEGSHTERIPARDYRKMTAPGRQARVAKQIGRLAEDAHLRGLEFVYWPKVEVRWLAPTDPERPFLTADILCPPGMEDEAAIVHVEISTTLRVRRPG